MWWFGIGVFIIEVTPGSLQLTALYGFSNGGALIISIPYIIVSSIKVIRQFGCFTEILLAMDNPNI
jgi:hypothetical protein